MWTSVLFGAKTFEFLEIYDVSHEQGKSGFVQCRHFEDKGGGRSVFFDFVRTSFMDGRLGSIVMKKRNITSNLGFSSATLSSFKSTSFETFSRGGLFANLIALSPLLICNNKLQILFLETSIISLFTCLKKKWSS